MTADRPTEFRGVFWDDGWEYDGPAVIYYPTRYRRVGYGGNSSALDSMVEDICVDILDGRPHDDGGLASECEWRGWGLRGFARRRRAWHVVFTVRWSDDDEFPEIVDRAETLGPPPGRHGR